MEKAKSNRNAQFFSGKVKAKSNVAKMELGLRKLQWKALRSYSEAGSWLDSFWGNDIRKIQSKHGAAAGMFFKFNKLSTIIHFVVALL